MPCLKKTLCLIQDNIGVAVAVATLARPAGGVLFYKYCFTISTGNEERGNAQETVEDAADKLAQIYIRDDF
jgi:hypothetical protein